ncbi:adhesion G-protein coupled receptor G5-like [Triplophysa dalaica]|uniref:adhesion G-protein coupled receptor G5-like n=1 Tax=Triplophysa dalaica TaxID=1582913 RepID=UPI0024DF4A49|nr:adhesion G-protein coupled receptor G5-like [Triplophysa dalaica]
MLSRRTMSWEKTTFLWLIFCATCQITCLKIMLVGRNLSVYSGDTGCPAVQLTCRPHTDTLTDNFCVMNVNQEASSLGNCTTESGDTFHFGITNNGSEYEVMMNETVRDVTLLFLPDQLLLPSNVYQNFGYSRRSFICLLDLGGILNVKYYLVDPQETCYVAPYNSSACDGKKESKYILQVSGRPTQARCVTCIKPSPIIISSEASVMMKNLENIANKMEQKREATIKIVMGEVKGLVYRHDRNTEHIIIFSSHQDEMHVTDAQNIEQIHYSWYVKISAEAFKKSRLENNGSAFVGVLQFKNIVANDKDKNLNVLNNEVYGISMGASISNLTDKIEIFIRARNLDGKEVYCNSWNGKGNLMWTTFGCETEFNTTIIKCSCSHLTFFAVLTTGPNSVTSTLSFYIGFALIVFLLLVFLFTFVPFRKIRRNQTTMIAMDSQVCRSSCN